MPKDPSWSWRYEAKCRGEDTNDWYPPRDKRLYKTIADSSKAICFGRDGRPECPVRMDCLRSAIESDELHGIWGGMSHRERNALGRKLTARGMTLDQYIEKGGRLK